MMGKLAARTKSKPGKTRLHPKRTFAYQNQTGYTTRDRSKNDAQ
jgi:hypothetical protein